MRAGQRREVLETSGSAVGLPEVSIDRHRDIIDAEIARADAFLALLEPAAAAHADEFRRSLSAPPSGWTLEALTPFLLRDWMNTPELDGMVKDRVGAALRQAFTDLSGISPFSRPAAQADCWRGWRRNLVGSWDLI